MNVAFQMDDLSKLNFTTDSTIELILESQFRDNNNYIYSPEDLFIENNQVYAEACKVIFKSKDITNYKCATKNKIKLSDMKMIFIRQFYLIFCSTFIIGNIFTFKNYFASFCINLIIFNK
jgi:glutathione synthase/RimK-type ligase-like ATP-grasp enzyme